MPGSELEAGRIFVDLIPRLQQGFGGAVEKELDGPMARIKSKAAGIGKVMAVGLGAGLVGGGALLLGAAHTLDGAYDSIRTGTGKIGVELESLKGSFRNVARDVPNDMEEVAGALAEVSKRTGQTGGDLEGITKQLLTLSRLEGSDVKTNIASATRLFGDWSIATKDQAGSLDYLYKVSQATGVGVAQLSDGLVKYGAPLRQLGFGFEESAALMGKFEKEGVNTGLVMGSLRVALGKMAKEGEAPVETLDRVVNQIKNAGSAGEANALALEVFGARAGPDMAAAIREGRFEVGSLMTDLSASGETIMGAAAETDDFAEKFAKLKNRAILAAEPLAGKLFDAINGVADAAAPVVGWIGERIPRAFDLAVAAVTPLVQGARQVFDVLARGDFTGGGPFEEDSPIIAGLFRARELVISFAGWLREKIPAALAAAKAAVAPVVSTLRDFVAANPGPVLAGIAAVVAAVVVPAFLAWAIGAGAAALSTLLAVAPVLLLVAAIALVAGGLVYAYQHSEKFREIVDGVVAWLQGTALPAVQSFAGYVADAFASLVGWVRTHWGEIQEAIGHVVEVVKGIVRGGLAVLARLWSEWGDEVLSHLRNVWTLIRSTVENGIRLVRGVIEFVLALVNGDWSKAWGALKEIVGAIFGQIADVARFGLGTVKNVITGILGGLKLAWETVWGGLKSFVSTLWHGMGDGLKAVLNGILSSIEGALNRAIDLLNDALDAIDKAAGPWVNFGEIPHVSFPRLARGGTASKTGLAIVGDGGNGSGAELLAMPRGASVVPLAVGRMIAEAALAGSAGRRDGAGVVFEEGAVKVDARGVQADQVGDLASRVIGYRVARRIRPSRK